MSNSKNGQKFKLTKIAAITLSAALIFGCDDLELKTTNNNGSGEESGGESSGGGGGAANLFAAITDTSGDTAGNLIYTLANNGKADLTVGGVSVDVVYPTNQDQDFSIGLYDDSGKTDSMVADIILQSNGSIQLRDTLSVSGKTKITLAATHTLGTSTNYQVSWDKDALEYTLTIDGSTIGTYAFNNLAATSVASFGVKLGSNAKVAAGTSTVDNIKIYSDIEMETSVFEDDFETGYIIGELLDGDGDVYSGLQVKVAGTQATDEEEGEEEGEVDFPTALDEFSFTSGSYANSGSATTPLKGSGNDTHVISNTAGATSVEDMALNLAQGSSVFEEESSEPYAYLSYTSAEGSGADQITGSFTLEAVINLSTRTIANDVALIDYADTSNYLGFKTYIESTDADEGVVKFKIYGGVIDDENQSTEAVTSSPLTRGSWSHIVTVYDADAADSGAYGSLTIYINGVEQATKNVNFLPVENEATDKFIIGGGSGSSDKNLDGDLDNIATWNVALTEAQVIERAALFGL